MSLPGDPSQSSITYKVTEQPVGSGTYRLRRMAKNGSQFRVIDVTSNVKDYLDLLATAAAAHEGGSVTP